MNPYATHLKLLLKVVEATTGPVLELGVGSASTPALHQACEKLGRRLVSYDSDSHYLHEYARKYGGPLHDFCWVNDWKVAHLEMPWSVALVDHRPARIRHHTASRLAQYAEYVVCHDTEPDNDQFYYWERAFRHYKFRFDDDLRPRTTVLSNAHEVTWLT